MFRRKSGGFRGGASERRHHKEVHAPEGPMLPGKLPVEKRQLWADPHALRKAVEGVVFVSLVLLIGIYGSMTYFRTTELARRKVCQGNLRMLGMAMQMYSQDHDGRLPIGGEDFVRQMFPYVPDLRHFFCPSDDLSGPRSRPGQRPKIVISYLYQKPAVDSVDHLAGPSVTPLMWDRQGGVSTGPHRQGGNVLYADWRTRWRPMHLWSAADRPW